MNVPPKDSRPRVGLVCNGNPRDFRTWSGTPSHMLEALEREFCVTVVIQQPWANWFDFARKVCRRLSGGRIDPIWSPTISALAANKAISELARSDCEYVFAIGVTGINYRLVESGKGIVFVSDATQAIMVNYNPRQAALINSLKNSARMMESACIRRAVIGLLPSEWARDSAVKDHGGDPEKMLVIPWGANLEPAEIIAPSDRNLDEWRLLFVGAVWADKGGDIVLDIVRQLQAAGRMVHLDVVGSAPPTPVKMDGVTFHGFLDKNKVEDRLRLSELYRRAHLFLLPTQFEALGIVFAEAASFALPAVSYRTGGIPGMVVDGETGILLPPGAGADKFVEAVEAVMSDRSRYEKMCNAALTRSQTRLNWAAWARSVREALDRRKAASGLPANAESSR